MRRYRRVALLAAALSGWSGNVALAHAPLARDLLLAPDGDSLALRMPGFGLVVREGADAAFEYACDALLGLTPADSQIAWAYRPDGALLIGTAYGLSRVPTDVCGYALVADLGDVPIAALAVSSTEPSIVVAVTADAAPALYRSDDGGETWTRRGSLPPGSGETVLRIDGADSQVLYVSRVTGTGTSVLLRSDDGGASFESAEQDAEVVLLHAESGPTGRLWVRARDASAGDVAILAADELAGPWSEVHRVRYFGGFAAATDGSAIWIGDEAGGVFLSTDGGDHFEAVEPKLPVACLVHARDALWACTPGLTTQAALAVSRDDGRTFEDVVAFADVDRMVACGAEPPVGELCAPAWNEWRADVQGMAVAPGSPPPVATADAAPVAEDAGLADAGSPATTARDDASSAGCSVTRLANALHSSPAFLFALVLAFGLGRALRRTRA